MTTGTTDDPAASAAAGQASRARKLGRRLTRWWSQAPDGRTYHRRQADALAAVAGLGVVAVCGVLVANRLVVGTDVGVFRRITRERKTTARGTSAARLGPPFRLLAPTGLLRWFVNRQRHG